MNKKIYRILNRNSSDVFRDTMLFSIINGIIAHAYIYLNAIYGHDSMNVAAERIYQSASQTRWFQDLLYNITNFTNTTWLAGIVSILIFAFSCYEIIDLFQIKHSISIAIITGIVITNPTIIASNLYSWPFVFFFAIIFMITALWLIEEKEYIKRYWLLSVILIALSLGTYAGYIAVYPTLVCFVVIRDIFDGYSIVNNIKKILYNIIIFSGGVVLYYVIERICLKLQNLDIPYYGTRDSLTHFIGIDAYLYGWYRGYIDFFNYLLGRTERFQYVPTLITVPIIILGLIILAHYWSNVESLANKILLTGIVLFLPLFVNFSYLAAAGMLHTLFYFSFSLVFVFIVFLVEKIFYSRKISIRISGCGAIALLFLFVWYGFVLANSAYAKAENMYVRSVSICTRILDDIEDNYTGEEKIILIGSMDMYDDFYNTRYGDALDILGGLGYVDPNYNNMFAFGQKEIPFLKNIMGSSLDYYYCEDKNECIEKYVEEKAAQNEIIDMPQYPCKGSVINVGEYIIVNLQ